MPRHVVPQAPSNLLGLHGLPAHFFSSRPPSWPWDVTSINLPVLLNKLAISGTTAEEVMRLLYDLSDVMLRRGLQEETELRKVLRRCATKNDLREQVVQRITEMTPGERGGCCSISRFPVRLVEGRALLYNVRNPDECLYPNDAIGWIQNGLSAIPEAFFSAEQKEVDSSGYQWLLPCPAFEIHAQETSRPALYIGRGLVNAMLGAWRTGFWMDDIEAGYTAAKGEIQAAWARQVPGASEPDPVYRFLNNPGEKLRREALLFLRRPRNKKCRLPTAARNIGGAAPKRGSWAHTGPPPVEAKWWPTPLEGSLKDLAKALKTSPDTIKQRHKRDTLWVRCIDAKKYQLFVRSKAEYDKAAAKLPKKVADPANDAALGE